MRRSEKKELTVAVLVLDFLLNRIKLKDLPEEESPMLAGPNQMAAMPLPEEVAEEVFRAEETETPAIQLEVVVEETDPPKEIGRAHV